MVNEKAADCPGISIMTLGLSVQRSKGWTDKRGETIRQGSRISPDGGKPQSHISRRK